jgi:hypothetical protein
MPRVNSISIVKFQTVTVKQQTYDIKGDRSNEFFGQDQDSHRESSYAVSAEAACTTPLHVDSIWMIALQRGAVGLSGLYITRMQQGCSKSMLHLGGSATPCNGKDF